MELIVVFEVPNEITFEKTPVVEALTTNTPSVLLPTTETPEVETDTAVTNPAVPRVVVYVERSSPAEESCHKESSVKSLRIT